MCSQTIHRSAPILWRWLFNRLTLCIKDAPSGTVDKQTTFGPDEQCTVVASAIYADCLIADVHSSSAIAAAWAYPALRLAYIAAYVANLPPLRSLCWAGAMTCAGLLYLEGLSAI